jgi:hypothetical protein
MTPREIADSLSPEFLDWLIDTATVMDEQDHNTDDVPMMLCAA